MPPRHYEPPPGMILVRPNRQKASSKTMKYVVVFVLLASAALIALITIGGWSKLEGAKVIQIAYIVIYIVMAFYVARWTRGVLPIASALAIIMAIFAAIAGSAWFDRDKTGFAPPQGLFSGTGLDVNLLGLLTYLVVPVQLLLIVVCMLAFRQNWQTEVEMTPERAQQLGLEPVAI
jgi:hypothetical protein